MRIIRFAQAVCDAIHHCFALGQQVLVVFGGKLHEVQVPGVSTARVVGQFLCPTVLFRWGLCSGLGNQALCCWTKLLVGIAKSCGCPGAIHREAFRA